MRSRFYVGLLLTLPCGWAEVSAQPPPAEELPSLIKQLGSERYRARERAMKLLSRQESEEAIRLLRKATTHADLEVRHRALQALRSVQVRRTTAQLLAPTKIKLAYRETPVLGAIEDLAKRTGLPLSLTEEDRKKLADRVVTLETGPITQWRALDMLCKQIKLHCAYEPAEVPELDELGRVIETGNRLLVLIDNRYGEAEVRKEKIVLSLTPKPAPASCEAGAMRLLALPTRPKPASDEMRAGKEVMLTLAFQLEKKLRWNHLHGIRITRAVDDQGRHLRPGVTFHDRLRGLDQSKSEIVLYIRSDDGLPSLRNEPTVLLTLSSGKKVGKMIKELHGLVRAELAGDKADLITIPDVEKAVGKTFKDESGTTLTLESLNAKRNADRPPSEDEGSEPSHELRVTLKNGYTPSILPSLPNVRIINRGRYFPPEEGTGQTQLIFTDGSGERHEMDTNRDEDWRGRRRLRRGFDPTAEELSVRFTPQKGKPAKLIYRAPKVRTVEVPFVIRDIVLDP